ncbi:MAG: hypothetical protein E6538_08550 [Paeniclostridium sordellii]|nr:hypothetical protein [Paeniclostridium sordellii]
MLLANLSSDELGVSSRENAIKYIQSKINSKKFQLNSLFDMMADFDDNLSDLFKGRTNKLGKEIKELGAKYNDLVNEVNSIKSEFKNVNLGAIIDKIRWNGDTDKVDIEF